MEFIWSSYELYQSSDNGIKVIKNLENNNIYTIIHFFFYLLSYLWYTSFSIYLVISCSNYIHYNTFLFLFSYFLQC
jgi:hypothetical protein